MTWLTDEDAVHADAAARLTGSTSKAWVEGVFRSYRTVNGGSATPVHAVEGDNR